MLKEKFLRGLLVTMGSLYLIFMFIYKFFSIDDPMTTSLRVLMILLSFSVYFLSYKIQWVYNQLEIIVHSLLIFSILQVIYYSYLFDFKIEISGLIFLTIILMNLIFKTDRFNFLINVSIGLLLVGSLWLKNKAFVSIVSFFFAYITIAFFSLYLKKFLQENKEKLENLANQAPGTLYQFQLMPDGRSKFPYASQGIYEIYEVRPEEIMRDASKAFKRIHPDDYAQVVESIQKSADSLEMWHDDYRVMLPKQGEKWVQGKAKPEKLEDGSILWHGNIREITKEKALELKIKMQKDRLGWIIEGIDAGTWEWNILTGETLFNEKWAEILGYTLDEISPTSINSWEKYTHPEDLEQAQKNLEEQFEFQKTLADISSSLLEVNSTNIDRRIDEALEKIGLFIKFDRSYIFQLSKDNKFISNTHEWCRLAIDREKENLQMVPIDKISWWMSKLSNNQVINIPSVSEMSKKAVVEQQMLKEQKVKSAVVMPIFIENELFGFFGFDSVENIRILSEKALGLLKIFTDVITSAFSKYVYDEKIIKLTFNDSLTGLYNRRFFENELIRLNTKRQLPMSIIIADINGLKIINDSLGHAKGDQLLIKSANVLESITRQEDILARQGGDEFAILLPQTDSKEAENIINRIKTFEKTTDTDELSVSMALGTATKTRIDQDIHEILRTADNHMYQNKLLESKSAKNNIIKSLLKTLEVKSNETKEHAIRMTKLAMTFGKKLGLSNSKLNRLALLSTLHDIGKITIPEEILKKPGKLTEKEWGIVKKHPESGYRIANASQVFALVAEAIYAHHEQWSGNGYPRQLAGEDIPYLARIISIIDAYDVMTNERPYKKVMSKNDALKEIEDCANRQFDPMLAKAFIKMMQQEKKD